MRLLQVLAYAFIFVCFLVLGNHYGVLSAGSVRLRNGALAGTTGAQWFASSKPYCNPVEVEMRLAEVPPPHTSEGAAYSAACLALAGQIDRARSIMQSLPAKDRAMAANVVFTIGQPVADSGDDKSAGPYMRLVLEFAPDNAMALYYAGISEFSMGEYGAAKEHLQHFVNLYQADDTSRMNAVELLSRLQ